MTPVGTILLSLLDGAARLDLSLAELLCRRAVTCVPADGAAISLADGLDRSQPLAASDERAALLARAQIDHGEGPGPDAVRTRRIRQVADLAARHDRWSAVVPVALAAGVRSITSFPLQVGGIRLGVLEVFAQAPGAWEADRLARALDHADAAVLVLLHMQEMWEADLDGGWVDDIADVTLRGRPEVHQATGMIAVQSDVSLAEALLLLRARAFAEERSVTEVASDVVEGRLRFDRPR